MMTPQKAMEYYVQGVITGSEVLHRLIMCLLDHDVDSIANVVEPEFMHRLKEWAFQEVQAERMVNLSQDPDELVNEACVAARGKIQNYFKSR